MTTESLYALVCHTTHIFGSAIKRLVFAFSKRLQCCSVVLIIFYYMSTQLQQQSIFLASANGKTV